MRRAFNFFNSYWCIANELSDKDRLQFYDALMLYQFTGDKSKIEALTGMAKFAYVSQAHSIESQISGYLDVCKRHNNKPFEDPTLPPTVGATIGANLPPNLQEKEKGKVKEKEETIIPVDDSTLHALQIYVRDNYPNVSSLKTQLTKEQCERLLGAYTKDAIKTKLDAMENKPNLKKNYLAVYNTLNNWLSMERQRNPNFGKLPLTPEQELEILKKERGYHVE